MFGELEIFLKEIDNSRKTFEQKNFEKMLVTVYYLGGRHGQPVKAKDVKAKANLLAKQLERTVEDAFKKGYLDIIDSSDEDNEKLKMTQTGRRFIENLLD